MSNSLAVLIWVAVAALGFAAGLIGVAMTRRRLARQDEALVSSARVAKVEVIARPAAA